VRKKIHIWVSYGLAHYHLVIINKNNHTSFFARAVGVYASHMDVH